MEADELVTCMVTVIVISTRASTVDDSSLPFHPRPSTMSFLVAHLAYSFLPPILGGILANAIDRVVGTSDVDLSRTGKKRPGAKGSATRTALAKVGLEWKSGSPGSQGWRRNRRVSLAMEGNIVDRRRGSVVIV